MVLMQQYNNDLRTTLRQAREQANITMAESAKRLHVTIRSVLTLELNDARGSAKVETVERALAAMGLAQFVVIVPIRSCAKSNPRREQSHEMSSGRWP
jgi:transcriptional regulator with XRE-family HTH domain